MGSMDKKNRKDINSWIVKYPEVVVSDKMEFHFVSSENGKIILLRNGTEGKI